MVAAAAALLVLAEATSAPAPAMPSRVFWPEAGTEAEPISGEGLVPLAGPELFVAVYDPAAVRLPRAERFGYRLSGRWMRTGDTPPPRRGGLTGWDNHLALLAENADRHSAHHDWSTWRVACLPPAPGT